MWGDDDFVDEHVLYFYSGGHASEYEFSCARGDEEAFDEELVEVVLSDGVAEAGDGEFDECAVEVVAEDVLGDDRVDYAEGEAGFDVYLYLVFGDGGVSACVHAFEAEVDEAHFFGAGVDEVESWFEEAAEVAEGFGESGWVGAGVPVAVGSM